MAEWWAPHVPNYKLLSAKEMKKVIEQVARKLIDQAHKSQYDVGVCVRSVQATVEAFKAVPVKREATQAEKQIEKLLDAVVEASNPRVITAYEKRIEKLEQQRFVLNEKAREMGKPPQSFDNLFEHSIQFRSNTWKLWKTGRFDMQRLVLKLTFSEHLQYSRETGFRTPKTTLPFKHLGGNFMQGKEMVRDAVCS